MTGLEVLGARAFYRPAGVMTFQHAVELVAAALERTRELGLGDILLNTSGLAGFEPPGVFERYAMVTRWVRCAGGVRIAIVARPAFIDHQRIGVLIAQNRGASTEVFTDEPSALAWLDARRARSASASRPARERAAGY
jgi:hypothetical protein